MNRIKKIWHESQFIRLYLICYKKPVCIGIAALILVDALEALLPLLLKYVVDALENKAPMNDLIFITLVYFVLHLFQALGRYGWRMYINRTSMFAGQDLREHYVEHLFSLSQNFFDRKKVGELMSLATNDTESIRRALGPGLLVFADALFYLIMIPMAMFYLSPELTLISFIPLSFIPVIVLMKEKKIHLRFTQAQEAFSHLSVIAQENLMGIRVIKSFAKELLQIKKFYDAGMENLKINMKLARVQSSFAPSLDFVLSLSLVLVLYFGGKSVLNQTLTLGTFIAFQRFIQKMVWPLEALGQAVIFYQRAVVSSKRIQNVIDEKPFIIEAPSSLSKNLKRKDSEKKPMSIEFKDLSFSYPGTTENVLKNINFKIAPGEKVAFVGSIGCGKSTLLCLLPRVYPVPSGCIFINEVDINEWPLNELRQSIGYVPQDHFLFSESVFQNIVFGLDEKNIQNVQQLKNDVIALTKVCSVFDDIESLPEKFDTKLGERGVNISGGQKQRISIARALMKQPSLLILDDSLSAVDTETEDRLLNAILSQLNNKTQMIAAHRISTVKKADRIIVLEKGKIVDQGSHSKLIQIKNGLYYKFYEQQRLKEEIDEWVYV